MNKHPVQRKEKDVSRRAATQHSYMKPRLLVATKNRHKVWEIAQILGVRWKVFGMDILPECPEIRETGKTFEENAALKAGHVREFLARSRRAEMADAVLADDSGLEVRALGGAPGVRSARYAGPRAGDARNREKLLQALGKRRDRRASFRCVLAVVPVSAKSRLRFFRGSVRGRIGCEERGARGFGYDCLFIPSGFDRTFAEMSAATKNRLSHRARALAKLRSWLARAKWKPRIEG